MRRSARLLAIHLLGALLIGGWSLAQVLAGAVTRENAAGVIVFPLAWIFGFWPTVVPIVLAHRIWRLRSTLEEICRRRAAGLPSAEQEGELEDALTLLAAQENGVPERWVRPFVRRVLRSRLNPPAPG
jgi:hypothetical protein